MSYKTPIRDIHFALNHMAGFQQLAKTEHYEELSDDLTSAILEEMAKYCDNQLAPLNKLSDTKGAVLENGVVRTTPGFKEAYDLYVEGGWGSLAFPEEVGGQNLPSTLSIAFIEALNAACMSFAIGTTLTTGAVKAIIHAGSDEQKALYLEKMVSGAWTGTMNLTEPQAGSDLSAIRAKAEPMGDGNYKISGQKIFITYGDHDLTDNIVHLVLARLPGAPSGTDGISMFLVPKYHVNADGSLGERNDVHCVSLEEKMGLHGSPTSVMAFGERGECYGTLLGQENKGLRNMFVMMNSARLDVGVQGIGVAECAYQHALAYALDRKQGRAPGVRDGDMIALFEHADIRRTLYVMKTLVEASRGICYANAVAADLAKTAKDEKQRAYAKAREALLTPVSKAWSTDRANEITSMGVQIHGGMGYIEETGVAQFMRDVRIAAIYEGTNGIQAMDLVGRKLQGDKGAAMSVMISDLRENATALKNHDQPILKAGGEKLSKAIDALEVSTQWILKAGKDNPHDPLAGATPYLKQVGNIFGGHYLALGVRSLLDSNAHQEIIDAKLMLFNVYADNFFPEAEGLTPSVTSGAAALAPLTKEMLAG